MSNTEITYLLVISDSKLYIVLESRFDKKKREYYIKKTNSEIEIKLPLKDIVINNLSFLQPNKKVTNFNSLYELWNTLFKKNNIYEISDFVLQAIKFYKIDSIGSLQVFIELFNKEFIFFKIVDNDKVYLNPKNIIEKIKNNINQKKKSRDLSEEFVNNAIQGLKIERNKFQNQISQISSYLSGFSDYQKSFISLIKKNKNLISDDEILDWGKKLNLFDSTFEPFYLRNKLSNLFSYNELDTKLTINKDHHNQTLSSFTIDDESTYDYDDAITIEKNNDKYILYVHVANFSDYFDYGSIYDNDAKKRISTIYTPSENFDLYRKDIVERIGLKEGETREVISIKFNISNFNLENYEVLNNFIKVEKNYSYKEFDEILPLNDDFKFLDTFTRSLNNERIKSADFESFNPELSISYDETRKLFLKTHGNYISSRIISELMILSNRLISEYMIDNSIPSIFRSQDESRNLEVTKIKGNRDFSFYRNVAQIGISTTPKPHYGLGLDSYLQYTSPIRRYYDSLIMRQLDSFLKNQSLFFSKDKIDEIIQGTIPLLESNKAKSKNAYKHWALKLIKQDKIDELIGYIYSDIKDKYIIFFNEYNFFDSIPKINCKRIYRENDKIRITFEFIDSNTLNIHNIQDIL